MNESAILVLLAVIKELKLNMIGQTMPATAVEAPPVAKDTTAWVSHMVVLPLSPREQTDQIYCRIRWSHE